MNNYYGAQGQPPSTQPYGTQVPPSRQQAPYGQANGQPPGTQPYGAPPGTQPYGQPPSTQPYGAPPSTQANYGQVNYGSPPPPQPQQQPPPQPYGQYSGGAPPPPPTQQYGGSPYAQNITYTHTTEKSSRSCWGWGGSSKDDEKDMAYADLMAAMDDVLTKYQNHQLPAEVAVQQADQIMAQINAIGQVDGSRATQYCQQRGITDAKRRWMDGAYKQMHAVMAGGPPAATTTTTTSWFGGPPAPPNGAYNATQPKGRKFGCC
eukprot:CAMPEP_0178412762 /NCGR_PEP_ID=MMETSP0689_2-20121128/22183_1 /TAXON_ID=160604 /ORGANISM="Amphidinium massartii, Strain CS-259" /LENGTH=261 /DNA_ID=CAMNT_0020034021 /DNA_START=47 /DNA_END=832 /DNA_ORIENTATION=-